MSPKEKLNLRLQKGFHICVGLDSDINKIPQHLKDDSNAIFKFNKAIIEKTHNIAAACKLNFAFYEKKAKKVLNCFLKH